MSSKEKQRTYNSPSLKKNSYTKGSRGTRVECYRVAKGEHTGKFAHVTICVKNGKEICKIKYKDHK